MPLEIYRFRTIGEFEQVAGRSTQLMSEGYKRIKGTGEYLAVNDTAKNSCQVLYIDGITSAGKTTTMNALENEISDAVFIPEFPSIIPPSYQNIGPHTHLTDQLRAQFWFYSQYLKKDREIRQYSGKIIVERGLLGLFCYSNLLGENKNVSSRIMWRATHHEWTPGLYIFLTARPEVLRERLISRQDSGAITHQNWENGMGDFIHALHRSVEEVARESNSPLIDTSDKSPEEVVREVKKLYDQFCITS